MCGQEEGYDPGDPKGYKEDGYISMLEDLNDMKEEK